MFRWSDKVSQLRREYSWLLFFSVPKLLLLHSLVDEMQPDLAAIVAEISFLFENDSDVREKLSSVVKVRRSPYCLIISSSYFCLNYSGCYCCY